MADSSQDFKDFIQTLLNHIDIVDIVNRAVSLKRSGRDFSACCPFHDEKTPSFTVSPSKQFYYCFGCGAHGSAIGFLMDYHGMAFMEAVEELATQAGMQIPSRNAGNGNSPDHTALYESMELVVQFFQSQLRDSPRADRARAYLEARGLSDELINTFELGYAPPGWHNLLDKLGGSAEAAQRLSRIGAVAKKDDGTFYDRFRDRIMFPIRDQRGRAVGFGGRVLDDGQPKYLNTSETPIFHKGRELYGLFHTRRLPKQVQHVYVVEGYMDVLALAQHGIKNAVASLGTSLTEQHLMKLYRHCPKLVLCFDGDEAGRKAAWRAMETALPLLKNGRQIYFMFMPAGEDPDTYVRAHGREKFEDWAHYLPLSDYLINRFREDNDIKRREGMSALVDGIVPLIGRLPEGALRALVCRDVEQLVGGALDIGRLVAGSRPAAPAPSHKLRDRVFTGAHTSPVTKAISLLLQNPRLAELVAPNRFERVTTRDVTFLVELLRLIRQQPEISCAAILEHWRDSKYEKRLWELSRRDNLLTDSAAIKSQFLEVIKKIDRDYQRQQRDKHLRKIVNMDDLRNFALLRAETPTPETAIHGTEVGETE